VLARALSGNRGGLSNGPFHRDLNALKREGELDFETSTSLAAWLTP